MRADFVIVGGGAGGLLLAARLGRRLGALAGPQRVLLVDRVVTHVWKPGLHEIAAGSVDSHQDALPYPLLARRNHFRFAPGELAGLDAENHVLSLAPVRDASGTEIVPARSLHYGRLALATGAGSNLFDVEGAAAHTSRLDDAEAARRLNRKLTDVFLGAAFSPERVLRLAIVGGGPTGVELAAELSTAHRRLIGALAPEQAFELDLTLLEVSPEILGALPEPVSDHARRTLKALGVRLITATEVTRVRPDGLDTADGAFRTDLTIWAAGTKAPEHNRDLGLKTGTLNQFVVDAQLRTSAPGVWAIGDCAQAPGPGERPLPARAQVAAQQARWLADAWTREDAGRPPPPPFVHRERGALLSLGEGEGAGALRPTPGSGRLVVAGVLARWLHGSLRLNHHREVLGLRRALLLALARRLRGEARGRAAVH